MMDSLSAQRCMAARILLIADNALGMRARTVVLEELGYQVTAVRCRVQGLHLFAGNAFDLVVTECKMPDGIELIERIREQKPAIPIVLISGFAEALGLDEANTGADVVIQKNCYEESALRRAVGRLLAGRTRNSTVKITYKQLPMCSRRHFRRRSSSLN